MDIARLKTLIDLVSSSGIAELEIIEGDERVRIVGAERSRAAGGGSTSMPVPSSLQAPLRERVESLEVGEGEPTLVKAPMFGVCHLTPAPDAAPFVSVGDKIVVGQTLCMIEAMKMFSSVMASRAGLLKTVLVESGCEVEPNQPLFLIE